MSQTIFSSIWSFEWAAYLSWEAFLFYIDLKIVDLKTKQNKTNQKTKTKQKQNKTKRKEKQNKTKQNAQFTSKTRAPVLQEARISASAKWHECFIIFSNCENVLL